MKRLVVCLLAAPSVALAHPGEEGLMHQLLHPEHLLATLAIAAVAAVVWFVVRKDRSTR